MIKTVVIAIWVCAVTLGAAYFGTIWDYGSTDQGEKQNRPTTLIKFKSISLPIVSDGTVAGYVFVQFSAVALADELKKAEVKPDPFFIDAVYKNLYARPDNNPSRLVSEDWTSIANKAKDAVNKQYGTDLLQNVLLDEFGFVPSGAARKDISPVKKTEAKKADAKEGGHH